MLCTIVAAESSNLDRLLKLSLTDHAGILKSFTTINYENFIFYQFSGSHVLLTGIRNEFPIRFHGCQAIKRCAGANHVTQYLELTSTVELVSAIFDWQSREEVVIVFLSWRGV